MFKKQRKTDLFLKLLSIIVILLLLVSCKGNEGKEETGKTPNQVEGPVEIEDDPKKEEYVKPSEPDQSKAIDDFVLETLDEGNVIFYTSEGYYRYGPSIIKNEDGSYDMWLSAPGNSGSQWDWITYRHSDDGVEWSSETTVLKPTPGSKDQCSVCDPGVIYFNGFYYLGYTGTDYYEGKGSDNMAFVARSKFPDGPFEKWNGSGWGGNPEPIIAYEGDLNGWGIGEVSFVIVNDDLYIFYSYVETDGLIGLYKADLSENWPATMRYKSDVLSRTYQDSLDVVYDDNLDLFFGFSVEFRMSESSRLIMYKSENGKEFEEVDTTKEMVEDFSHNMGIAKSKSGHIDSNDELLIGYAYGQNWGRWNLKTQSVRISHN